MINSSTNVELSTSAGMAQNPCYMPLILDACCSTRSFWFDKNDDRVLFHDLRNETYHIKPDKSHPKRTLVVKPDVVGDFTKMVFDDNTFQLVVFDPPFIKFGVNMLHKWESDYIMAHVERC